MFRSKSLRLGLTGISLALLAAGCNLIAGLDSPTYDPSLDNPGNTAADGSTNTEDGSVVGSDGSTTEDGGVDLDSGPPPFIDLTKLTVDRIAGQPGGPAFRDGTKVEARFAAPQAIATDVDAGIAYVLDSGNHAVRKVSLADGSVTTLSRDGFLSYPELRAIAIVTPAKGRTRVIVTSRHALVMIDDKGNQSILAGSPNVPGYQDAKPNNGANARFTNPWALATDGERLWVADNGTCSVRTVDPATGETSTLSGTGECKSAALTSLTGVAYNPATPKVLYAAAANGVYTIAFSSLLPLGDAPTLYSNGVGSVSLAINSSKLYGVDPASHVVRFIEKSTSAIVGGAAGSYGFKDSNKSPTEGTFYQPSGIASGRDGQLYVADTMNNAIRLIDFSATKLETLVGGGPSHAGSTDGNLSTSTLSFPQGVAFESVPGGDKAAAIDSSGMLRVVNLADLSTSTPAFSSPIKDGRGVVRDSANGKTYVADAANAVVYVLGDGAVPAVLAGEPGVPGTPKGVGVLEPFNNAHFDRPSGLALDAVNGILYVADSGNKAIRKLDLKASQLNTLGGPFTNPVGITVDKAGNLYVSDYDLNQIWRVGSGVATCIAGDCEKGSAGHIDGSMVGTKPVSRFTNPQGVVHDGTRFLYIADTGNHVLRAIDTTDPNYRVITIIGDSNAAAFATGSHDAARLNMPAWLTLIQTGTDLKTTGLIGSDFAEHVLFRVKGL